MKKKIEFHFQAKKIKKSSFSKRVCLACSSTKLINFTLWLVIELNGVVSDRHGHQQIAGDIRFVFFIFIDFSVLVNFEDV